MSSQLASPKNIAEKDDTRSKDMKPSTDDQIKGTVHEAKGTVKEKVGLHCGLFLTSY